MNQIQLRAEGRRIVEKYADAPAGKCHPLDPVSLYIFVLSFMVLFFRLAIFYLFMYFPPPPQILRKKREAGSKKIQNPRNSLRYACFAEPASRFPF